MMNRIGLGLAVAAALVCGRAALACPGDCSRDGNVTVDELVTGVSIALGNANLAQCPSFDSSDDEQVTVDELVGAVGSALNGCPFQGQFYARVQLEPGQSATLNLTVDPQGNATGTLKIDTGGSAANEGGEAALFIIDVFGHVDVDKGTFSIGGSANVNGMLYTVDLSGTLPGPSGGGSLTLTVNGMTYFSFAVPGDGSTPTPTRTLRPSSTPTPTATITATPRAATNTPVPSNTVPPTATATPTVGIVPPGISAALIGTWAGSAINEPKGINKQVRIKIEVRSNQVIATDLSANLFKFGREITMSFSPAAPQALFSNRTISGSIESFTLSLFPTSTIGLAGIYSTTAIAFPPPPPDALALDLRKQ